MSAHVSRTLSLVNKTLVFDVLIITDSDVMVQIWDRDSLECAQVLQGHTGSVLCLQYDENVIISGSSDATVRSDFTSSSVSPVACHILMFYLSPV